jgi:excisionase family DNA binding protein
MTTPVDDDIRRDEKGRPLADDGYPISGMATVQDAIAVSSLSRTHIYDLMTRNELQSMRFGRSRRIPWSALRELFLQAEVSK